ncbi:type I-E CRISPR-associated protein Cas7/Cse4/CasC [Nocardiopsis alba]|uniref:Type I-E CRISPR-associated protein Cas7/Cse4/CasC n=1 Tax=Nocardiopsis alba TaxID=53437 RepID=A0A7K2IWN9_9ACTN|nr:type I-E CRISPR-associated protein Cas7/Cse4/CasC [Nocardiopsis alba]MYR34363.1 type I-E CRISPR-associated protein Cas7/Cse4/CasC [Nocardiopsis alba]
MAFLDIHAIQAVPPANINRDENGSPKTAVYGGVRRLRVSSQAWKRAARKALEADSDSIRPSERTKRLPEQIAAALAERSPALADRASEIAQAAVANVFGVKSKAKKEKDTERERLATEYLLFLGNDQRDRLIDALVENETALAEATDSGKDSSKKLTAVFKEMDLRSTVATGHPPAVALFGRMVATDPALNVDAATQVAHALSTHRVDSEFDYYTAVDDVDNESDETGAGMIGTVEFNAATMYRYATVDLHSLVENLGGDIDAACDVAVAFVKAFLLSMPTGKRNTFANNTRPDFSLLSLREDQPVSLAAAFERPVFGEDGHLGRSVQRLVEHQREQDECYGTDPLLTRAVYPAWVAEGLELPESTPLKKALDDVRAEIHRLIGGGDA